jgi:hypothetical protein
LRYHHFPGEDKVIENGQTSPAFPAVPSATPQVIFANWREALHLLKLGRGHKYLYGQYLCNQALAWLVNGVTIVRQWRYQRAALDWSCIGPVLVLYWSSTDGGFWQAGRELPKGKSRNWQPKHPTSNIQHPSSNGLEGARRSGRPEAPRDYPEATLRLPSSHLVANR